MNLLYAKDEDIYHFNSDDIDDNIKTKMETILENINTDESNKDNYIQDNGSLVFEYKEAIKLQILSPIVYNFSKMITENIEYEHNECYVPYNCSSLINVCYNKKHKLLYLQFDLDMT